MSHRFAILMLAAITAYGTCESKTRVACIGNSITYGLKIQNREVNCYPSRLQAMLGETYEVNNFGHSGATLLKHGHRPFVLTQEWEDAKKFAPDIAVIHLGTNDTDPRNWPNYGDEFIPDYKAIIDTLRMVNPGVHVIVANMAPIGAAHPRFKTGTCAWRDSIRNRIVAVAEITGSELIDFNVPLRDFPNLIPDAVHPDNDGASLLANYVYKSVTGEWGPLRLPEVWQSGMVVPWGRTFTIPGHSDAHAEITLHIKGKDYNTKANHLGEWSISLDPLPPGGNFSITVTDGKDTITIDNVTAGEVWLASGQSNMAFMLSQAEDTPKVLTRDSLVRFFDMFPIAFTDGMEWDEQTKSKMENLQHYNDSRWGLPTGSTSAVAWNFAVTLVDSLRSFYGQDIPVGIISNAVGGSGTEAWIDIETLQHLAPDALVDWKHNDWIQPWVRKRAAENSGSDNSRIRHPYEPSYLFASGIRPLEGFPIKGVIWYQGESNAHNAELHELYFRALEESWRKEFDNPELPFIFAQLSGMERPSWPAFRDSQRRIADKYSNTYMAVTHDLGDRTDVHPKRKAPVGHRLGLLALAKVYGAGIESEGPLPVWASANVDGSIFIKMKNSTGLASCGSDTLKGFEIAQYEGCYEPADVRIVTDGVILSNPKIKNPRYARYAWQPFTDANMINKDSLPASTFKIEADLKDKGIEYGVSGAFAGKLPDGRIITAGGCNFPFPDPISVPANSKTFYSGIYDVSTGKRIGMLPKPLAYGASVSTKRGVVMIGGTGSSECFLFDGHSLTSLPMLPESVDNGYASTIDETIYLIGNGKLYQLFPEGPEWEIIETVPGDIRIQPVMASSGNKLYIWGGFTPAHDGKNPKVHEDGLVYDTATHKWSKAAAPEAEGSSLTLSGGVAVSCPDGSIIASGGVNHKIFLDAITCQAPDYLEHPAEWYRFNPYVLRYEPKRNKWSVLTKDTDFARAGATAVYDGGRLIVLGGELKPRVRTPKTSIIEMGDNN